jgi:hypothetical protein
MHHGQQKRFCSGFCDRKLSLGLVQKFYLSLAAALLVAALFVVQGWVTVQEYLAADSASLRNHLGALHWIASSGAINISTAVVGPVIADLKGFTITGLGEFSTASASSSGQEPKPTPTRSKVSDGLAEQRSLYSRTTSSGCLSVRSPKKTG